MTDERYYCKDGSLKWGFPENVEHLILQLQTLNPEMKVSSVIHIDMAKGGSRARAYGLSMSRERWDDSGWLNWSLDTPECLAFWCHSKDRDTLKKIVGDALSPDSEPVSSKAAEAPGGQQDRAINLLVGVRDAAVTDDGVCVICREDPHASGCVMTLVENYIHELDDTEQAARAAPSERADDWKEAVKRLAKFIAQKESFNCKTLDESLHHQSKWERIIPEAEELLNAAFPVSSQEGNAEEEGRVTLP